MSKSGKHSPQTEVRRGDYSHSENSAAGAYIGPTSASQHAIDQALKHHQRGDIPEAKKIYEQMLQSEPEQPEALHLLGVAEHQLGKNNMAAKLISKALVLRPDYVPAHFNLGMVYQQLERLDDAITSFSKALTLKPDHAMAHHNIGDVFRKQGRLAEAVESYQRALMQRPDYAAVYYKLGLVYMDQGCLEEAFECHQRAVVIDPADDLLWYGLAASLENRLFTSVNEDLLCALGELLKHPMAHPDTVYTAIMSAVYCHKDFRQSLKVTNSDGPLSTECAAGIIRKLTRIPLLLQIMKLCSVRDIQTERMLTVLRRTMMKEVIEEKFENVGFPFLAALAMLCFNNAYVFSESVEEMQLVKRMEQQIEGLLRANQAVPPHLIATLGTYRPLHSFPWGIKLSEGEWTGEIKEVIWRQILQPHKEQKLRKQIPTLTPISDTVSLSVREQYEENPYPQWIKVGIPPRTHSIAEMLQSDSLKLNLGNYVSPEQPEVLIAGCGTGQHAIMAASNLGNARVLAIDLSLSSLSYAMRKTKELGLSDIEFAQADIMELGLIGQQFDLIESVGVLHHLCDPVSGWQILVNLLRPGGLMKIGLYSQLARRDVVAGRAMIAEKHYSTSAEDIRTCRQDISAEAACGNQQMESLCRRGDFYSTSECRDLLFHVQEHRFTLPQIQTILNKLKLQFLGFELKAKESLLNDGKEGSKKYKQSSLSHWHQYELKNPDTFRAMYQFWCKKI